MCLKSYGNIRHLILKVLQMKKQTNKQNKEEEQQQQTVLDSKFTLKLKMGHDSVW